MCNIILKLIKNVDYQLLSLQLISIDAWWSIHWTLTHHDSETLITFFTQISTTISIHDIVRMVMWSSTVSIKQLHVHSHCNATEHDEQFTVRRQQQEKRWQQSCTLFSVTFMWWRRIDHQTKWILRKVSNCIRNYCCFRASLLIANHKIDANCCRSNWVMYQRSDYASMLINHHKHNW